MIERVPCKNFWIRGSRPDLYSGTQPLYQRLVGAVIIGKSPGVVFAPESLYVL